MNEDCKDYSCEYDTMERPEEKLYRYNFEERPIEPRTCYDYASIWCDIADWEASRADYNKDCYDDLNESFVELIKGRLPLEFAEKIADDSRSDAFIQLGYLVAQYHNESIFADDCESLLQALRSIITDKYMIMQIDDVLASRYKRYA